MRISGKYENANCFSDKSGEIIKETICSKYEKGSSEEELVNNLLIILERSSKDASDALRILSIVKKQLSNRSLDYWLIEVLCQMFIYCLPGHPCKRSISKIIDHLTNDERTKKCFESEILNVLNNETQEKYGLSCYHVSETIEIFCLSAQSEIVIAKLSKKILQFLMTLMEELHTALLQPNSNQELFSIDQKLNQILKSINLVFIKLIKNKNTDNNLMEFIDDFSKKCPVMLDNLHEQALNSMGLLFPNLFWVSEIYVANQKPLHSQVSSCFNSVQTHMNTVSKVSQIALCNGILVFVVHLLKQPDIKNVQSFFDDQLCEILQLLLKIEESVNSTSHHVVLVKCLLQWTITVKDVKKSELSVPNAISTMDKLLNFISINLDSSIDIIRHLTKDMLKTILSVKHGTSNGVEFIDNLSKDILKLWNWNKRSFYVAMSSIVEYIDVDIIVSSHQNIQEKLLKAISDQGLVTYASQLYYQLAVNQKKTCQLSIKDQMDAWLLPVFKTLTRENCNKNLVVNYCLKKLVKLYGTACMSYTLSISSNLTHDKAVRDLDFLNVFMMCARTAQQLGLLQQKKDAKGAKGVKAESSWIVESECANGRLWRKGITMEIIQSALVHPNNQMRIESFMLICDNPRPSIPLSQSDVELIKFGLPYNMKNPCPDFRQQLLMTLKKLVARIVINHQRIVKRNKNKKNEEDSLEMKLYEDLYTWFFEFTFKQLFTGAMYPRRCMSLGLLVILVSELSIHQGICSTIYDIFTTKRINTLVEMLKIPYEDIKNLSVNILSHPIIKMHVSLQIKDKIECLEKNSLNFCRVSCKTEVCKESAYSLLFIMKSSHNPNQIALRYVHDMVSQLLEDISYAEKSLLEALIISPMYGSVYCIRLILSHLKIDSHSNPSDFSRWRQIIAMCIESCIRVSIAVLPVVGNDSPEGHLPRIAIQSEMEALDDVIKPMLSKDDIKEDERIEAQRVLLSCWRSSKESFLLLQSIIELFPLDSSPDNQDAIISWKQILEIGEHLRSQLLQAKHRGAFEIASCAFKSYCHFLWRRKEKELSDKPVKWIEEVTDMICKNSSSMTLTLCSTRRSAGLPFYLQALLGSDRGSVIQASLDHVMSSLLETCDLGNLSEAFESETINSIIHSLNVLRGLVKDACLGEMVQSYVSSCLKIAIRGFGCRVWSIRNSSTLFFSTLMNRIFGVKREKDLETSNKNRLSSQEFCTRMPGLLDFLLSYLNDRLLPKDGQAGSIERQCSVYPVLLVVSRIYPSPTHTSNLILSKFLPALNIANGCLIYKCRDMASTALCNLIPTSKCLYVIEFLLSGILVDRSQNFVHGTLIQVLKLVKRKLVNEKELCLNNSLLLLHKCNWIASRYNPCLVTWAVYLELYLAILPFTSIDLSKNEDFLSLVKECRDVDSGNIKYEPGAKLLCQNIGNFFASLYLRNMTLTEIHAIFLSQDEDKILGVLSTLKQRRCENNTIIITDLKEDFFGLLPTFAHCSEIMVQVYDLLSFATKSDQKNSLRIAQHLSRIKLQNNESLVVAVVACWAQAVSCIIEDRTLNLHHIISCLLDLMQNSLSPLHNDVTLRRVVSLSHQKIAPKLMLEPALYGPMCSRAWYLAFMLLVDEDSDVRDHASVTIYELSNIKCFGLPCVDTYALECAVDLFKCKFNGSQTFNEVVCLVEKLVDNNIFQENDLESPLFDNTVINTYMETEVMETLLERETCDHYITA